MADIMKIIVAGAGPAGPGFSIRAVSQGHDVVLLERRKDERTSFCGEMTTLSLMPEGFARRLAAESVLSHSKNIGLIFLDENYRELSRRVIPHSTSVLIDSGEFRSKLKRLAEKEGVEFMFNTVLERVAVRQNSVSAIVRRKGKGDRNIGKDTLCGSENLRKGEKDVRTDVQICDGTGRGDASCDWERRDKKSVMFSG